MQDQGLWIAWYDLPKDGRDAYLTWLHEIHIPQMLQRPGFLWAAHYGAVDRGHLLHVGQAAADPRVPGGTQFILMFGAHSAKVFGSPAPQALHAALPASDRKMLGLRMGERTTILVESARVEGKGLSAHASGIVPAPCIQLGSFNCPWQHEEELHAWFTQWRMPVLQAKPSCVRIRKMASVTGWAKHGILYEYLSLESRARDWPTHEDPYPDMRAWSRIVVGRLQHAPPGSGSVATRIWPPVASNN